MRLTDAQITETVDAMKKKQRLVLGPHADFRDSDLDRLRDLALKGDPGARLVVYKAWKMVSCWAKDYGCDGAKAQEEQQ